MLEAGVTMNLTKASMTLEIDPLQDSVLPNLSPPMEGGRQLTDAHHRIQTAPRKILKDHDNDRQRRPREGHQDAIEPIQRLLRDLGVELVVVIEKNHHTTPLNMVDQALLIHRRTGSRGNSSVLMAPHRIIMGIMGLRDILAIVALLLAGLLL